MRKVNKGRVLPGPTAKFPLSWKDPLELGVGCFVPLLNLAGQTTPASPSIEDSRIWTGS